MATWYIDKMVTVWHMLIHNKRKDVMTQQIAQIDCNKIWTALVIHIKLPVVKKRRKAGVLTEQKAARWK